MGNIRIICATIVVVVASLVLTACSTTHDLVATPNLYSATGVYPEAEIPAGLKTTKPTLLYITDRQVENTKDGRFSYGIKRSPSMAFGQAEVSFGDGLSWQQLHKASSSGKRKTPVKVSVTDVREILRFPATPLPFGVRSGNAVSLSGPQAEYNAKTRQLQKVLSARLASANRREVVMFVHGYNNNFNEAALSLADIWHFSGRVGVPVFYTWPAGNSGLTGYFKDREAGEFSVFHFKETIKIISATPGLEAIHIIAHSRGTDVVTTALRELMIAERAAGRNPRKTLKVQNLTLAAPDLDFGVVRQRLIAERFGPVFGQVTVYMNKSDGALNLSQSLMSGLRFGRIGVKDLEPSEKKIFAQVKNVNFIDVEDVGGFIGHAYFRENPAVLSDIAITIRSSLSPGHTGRPLKNIGGNFWLLDKHYPLGQ